MFPWLFHYLAKYYPHFIVFNYLSLRYILAALTSLMLVLLLGSPLIRWLQRQQIGQVIRRDGPSAHFEKKGTPTMGGVLVLFAISVSALCWGNLTAPYLWVCLITLIGYGIIGYLDDYLKVVRKHSEGLKPRWKFFWQSVLGISLAAWMSFLITPAQHGMVIPFFANTFLDLGWGFLIFSYLMITGFSNAVNLTDGLDGLAIVPCVLVGLALLIFAYVTSNVISASYLLLPYIPEATQIGIVGAALGGAGLGFLWFNAYPAQVFMGDVGSLSLGALLAVMAILLRQEIIFIVMGAIFVIETLSVILQVGSYKLRKKRIFKMAPIHHHFELKGWPEPKVVIRFWIITLILVLFGLATLKLR